MREGSVMNGKRNAARTIEFDHLKDRYAAPQPLARASSAFWVIERGFPNAEVSEEREARQHCPRGSQNGGPLAFGPAPGPTKSPGLC